MWCRGGGKEETQERAQRTVFQNIGEKDLRMIMKGAEVLEQYNVLKASAADFGFFNGDKAGNASVP